MYILKKVDGSEIYLLNNEKYTVGRRNCDITLNDISVSRRHAEIIIKDNIATVIDSNSKYFTWHQNKKLNVNEPVRLNFGDTIRFGVDSSTFTFEKHLIITTNSNVSEAQKENVSKAIRVLGGTVMDQWSTSCTHLTMEEVMVTIKVLHAILDNKPIVNVNYWTAYVESLKEKKPPPDIKNYSPPLGEALINHMSLEYDPKRHTLFNGKIFIFATEKAKCKMQDIISKAGGTSLSWQKNPPKNLEKNSSEYVIIEPKENDISKSLETVLKFDEKNGKRSIPTQEIVMAILQCSCEKNCNPYFNRTEEVFLNSEEGVVKKEIVAGTQTQDDTKNQSSKFHNKTINVVPESLENVSLFLIPSTSRAKEEYSITDETIEIIDDNCETQNVACGKRQNPNIEFLENPSKKLKFENVLPLKGTGVKNIDKKKQNAMMYSISSECKLTAIKTESPISKKRVAETHVESTTSKKMNLAVNPFANILETTDGPKPKISSENPLKIPVQNIFKPNLSTNKLFPKNEKKNKSVKNENSFIKLGEEMKKMQKKQDATSLNAATLSVGSTTLNSKGSYNSKAEISLTSLLYDFQNVTTNGKWQSKVSKSNIKVEAEEMDPDLKKFIERFNNTIIVVKKPLTVKKEVDVRGVLEEKSGNTTVLNFKKFKKVPVMRPQQTIISNNTMSRKYGMCQLSITCDGNDSEEEVMSPSKKHWRKK